MGESRTHNQSNREIRFRNCRQVLPVKSGVRSLERLKPGMAAGLDRGLPTASLVIVLDVPVLSSFGRKSSGRDVHERDKRLLLRVGRTYRTLAKKLAWEMVDANRPVEEVREAVWGIVRKKFRFSS